MDDMTELDDAIIEDTCHCSCCNSPFVLGDNEPYVILDPPEFDTFRKQVSLCGSCAGKVSAEYVDATAKAQPKLPEEEGWYWCRKDDQHRWAIREVFREGTFWLTAEERARKDTWNFIGNFDDCEWHGPIPEPS